MSAAARAPGSRHVWLALLALFFAAKLAIVLWGADRGLDIGDDGVFLFSLNDPASAPPLFEFYKLLALFDPPPRFDLVEIRIARVVAELAATFALAAAVFAWARLRFPESARDGFARFALFASLGSLLGVGARGFGYNDATNVASFAACAALFRTITVPAEARARRLAWAATAGFALGFQLFVKFPPALLLFPIGATGILALVRADGRARAAALAAFVAGAAAAIGCFVAANGGVEPLVAKWREAQTLNRDAGYGIGQILSVYYYNDYASHVNGLRLVIAFGFVFAALRRLLRGRSDAADWALTAALLAGGAALAWGASTLHAPNVHPTLIAFFCLVLLLASITAAMAAWARRETDRIAAVAPLLLLLVLPFVLIVGTNVALTLKLPAHAAPLFLLLAISLPSVSALGLRRFAATASASLLLLTAAVFAEHQIHRPYGLPSPLYEQTERTPLLPELRVDRATRQLVEDLHARLIEAGFAPGDPLVALDFMPGLVYAVGGRSPGFPFYAFDKPAQNCWALERAKLDRPPFLLLGQDMLAAQHACIRSFEFPEQFRRVAVLRNPYEAPIRYFFGAPPMPYLQVFAPLADAPN